MSQKCLPLIKALLNHKSLRQREWSGPAWFTYKTDKNGFPCSWNLEFFWVLDVGSKSETDWDENNLVKDYAKLWEIAPETKTNKWYRGNIHSHNTMKAFFSATDIELLNEMSEDNNFFYPSIICADSEEPWAFAVGYKDQYGFTQMLEGDITGEKIPKVKGAWADRTMKFVKDFVANERKVAPQQQLWGGNAYNTGFTKGSTWSNTGQCWIKPVKPPVHQPLQEIIEADATEAKYEKKREALEVLFSTGQITEDTYDLSLSAIDDEEILELGGF